MTTQYFIAVLITGPVGDLTSNIQRRFRVPAWTSHLPPHLTLVPPFRLKKGVEEQELIEAVAGVGGQYQLFPIRIDGIGRFDNERITLYARVKNSLMLQSLHAILLDRVRARAAKDPISFLYTPHVTLSNQLTPEEATTQLREMGMLPISTFTCKGFTLFRRLDDGDWEEVVWAPFV